jgi:hypothetical protein
MGPPPGLLAVSFLQSIAANIGKRRAKSVKPLLLFSRVARPSMQALVALCRANGPRADAIRAVERPA